MSEEFENEDVDSELQLDDSALEMAAGGIALVTSPSQMHTNTGYSANQTIYFQSTSTTTNY